MSKIFAYLNRNQDKLIHLLSGYVVATIIPINPLWGLFIAIVAGKVKEDYDADHPDTHTADKYDMFATWTGGLIGYISLIIK